MAGAATDGINPATGAVTDAVTTSTTTNKNTSTLTASQGTITALKSGGDFDLLDTSTHATLLVHYPATSYVNTSISPLLANRYAIAVGTVSSGSLAASYAAVLPSAPAPVSVSGTFLGFVRYGAQVRDAATGSTIPVMIARSTTMNATPAVGSAVTVTGVGSTHAAVLATAITSSSSSTSTAAAATPAPSPGGSVTTAIATTTTAGVPLHVLTADYLGTPFGTTSVSAAQAQPYLSWASTGIANTNAMHALGIKTEVYFSPDRTQSNDPLYHSTSTSGFSKTCSSANVTTKYGSITQYIMNNASSALHSSYASYVSSVAAGGHVDAIFEDNGLELGHYASTSFTPGLPCSYTDATWIAGEKALETAVSVPTILNGMNGLNGHNPSMLEQVVEGASKSIGGDFESCFVQSNAAANGSWPWTATEQTQIDLVTRHKIFQCMGLYAGAASGSVASRLYQLASFEMTYDPSYSILWSSFATPSRVHVMPESGFVALQPRVATPASIASLKTPSGNYVREYNACYYRGKLVGACAMVVNPDSIAHARPAFAHTFAHRLAPSGNGVLDGGTVSFTGAAPGTVPALSAYIALP